MAQLDNIIHQTVRLQIMSSLVSLDQNEHVNFTYLRKLLKLTDGNLGEQGVMALGVTNALYADVDGEPGFQTGL